MRKTSTKPEAETVAVNGVRSRLASVVRHLANGTAGASGRIRTDNHSVRNIAGYRFVSARARVAAATLGAGVLVVSLVVYQVASGHTTVPVNDVTAPASAYTMPEKEESMAYALEQVWTTVQVAEQEPSASVVALPAPTKEIAPSDRTPAANSEDAIAPSTDGSSSPSAETLTGSQGADDDKMLLAMISLGEVLADDSTPAAGQTSVGIVTALAPPQQPPAASPTPEPAPVVLAPTPDVPKVTPTLVTPEPTVEPKPQETEEPKRWVATKPVHRGHEKPATPPQSRADEKKPVDERPTPSPTPKPDVETEPTSAPTATPEPTPEPEPNVTPAPETPTPPAGSDTNGQGSENSADSAAGPGSGPGAPPDNAG